jgi:alkylation response protein AidB-like acyl-CoA dehydrogenase
MFSEPTHGSDVAGIHSRAVREGDHWVVNGQKVWTTLAHVARRGLLLARTDPDVPKHLGLSYFVVDMQAPGVEVRPLHQLTGEAEFNEVFLTDVRIPSADMLGSEGDGWRVATATLMNERMALSGGGRERGTGPIRHLLDVWDQVAPAMDGGRRASERSRVAALWIRAEVARLTGQRAKQAARAGQPGPEGSIGKLASAELTQDIYEAAVDLLGPLGMVHAPGYPRSEERTPYQMSVTGRFLRSRANTIEGGTSEIMRNILGERVLGLPADIRADADMAWADIPR